jgi:hypothetical protein
VVVAHRYCPVADCSAYPDPAQARGITIATLQNWVLYVRSAEAQIRAAPAWHVNLVRLQIVQDKMVGPKGNMLSPRYANAVRAIVHYALVRHLSVVLNAQTELSIGWPLNEPMPTPATYSFWRHMVTWYGHNPQVIFDLFNEPRGSGGWPQWQAAFQPLVNYVRGRGSENEFWVEGIVWASTLQGVPLLHGQGIVYEYHHPGCPHPFQCATTTVAVWNAAFGYLRAQRVPVVDGEFVSFRGGYDWRYNSTVNVTRYLLYCKAHGIGMVAWSLQPGIMTATTDLTTAVSEPQGAGRLFWKYFHGTLGAKTVAASLAAGEGAARSLR